VLADRHNTGILALEVNKFCEQCAGILTFLLVGCRRLDKQKELSAYLNKSKKHNKQREREKKEKGFDKKAQIR